MIMLDSNTLKNYYIYLEYPLESEENDIALTIHLNVKRLFIDGLFTKQDVDILDYYIQGFSQREISNFINVDRRYLTVRIKYILNTLLKELNRE